MKTSMLRIALVSAASLSIGSAAFAGHSWNDYHWSFDGQLEVKVGDNVDDGKWLKYLQQSMTGGSRQDPEDTEPGEGWNATSQIESPIVAGSTNPKNCKAVSGTIQACSNRYGQTGWLGVAQIWLSGGHIVQATTKVNDTYFDTARYNTPGWRMMVMCQEIGHDYGLGHVNENFDDPNTGSCMDYTNDPARDDGAGTNEYIDQHDKDQLGIQYGHTDTASSTASGPGKSGARVNFPDNGIGGNTPASWGRAVSYDGEGRPNRYLLDMGNGLKRVTHVTWALGEGPRGRQH